MEIDENSKFKFKNKEAYQILASHLTAFIQMRLERQFGLVQKLVPFKRDLTDEHSARAPVFVSPDWKTNGDKALILIQGTGSVRAGVWAQSV